MGPTEPDALPRTYQKGTIEGYETRGVKVGASIKVGKVYELRGETMIYEITYCGSFQAGQFTAGQVIEFHVDGDRLYIRHDNDKEYDCQMVGS